MRTLAAPSLLALCLIVQASAAAEPAVDSHGDPLPPLARLRIGTTRLRHGDEIIALAFSPDGKAIATAGRDATVSLWETASGKELLRCRTHRVAGLGFTDGGKALLWCGTDGNAYRVATNRRGDVSGQVEKWHDFTEGSGRVEAIAFAPDGGMIAATSESGIVLRTPGADRVRLLVRQNSVQCLTLVSANLLAVNDPARKGVGVYDLGRDRERRSFGSEAARSLAASPDGRILAVGDFDNRIRLWDPATSRLLRTLEGHRSVPVSGKNGVFCLAFAPDGKTLASGAADGTVRLWDVAAGKQTACCEGHGARVLAVAFAPDGKQIASGGGDGVVRLWGSSTGRAVGPVSSEGGAVMGLSVSADGRTLALVRQPGGLGVWDLAAGKEHRPALAAEVPVSSAAFGPDGKTLFTLSTAGRLQTWNFATGTELRPPRNVQQTGHLLCAAADGKTVAWYGTDHRIVLWDAPAGKLLRRVRPEGGRVSALVFSPDGRTLVSAGQTGLRLYDVTDRERPRDFSGEAGGVLDAAMSPDGRMLATGGPDGMIRLWETASGAQRRRLFGGPGWVRSVAFSADGALLATGNSDGTVRLWDLSSGKRLHQFAGHRGAVVGVAFAGKGASLVTASQDATALVWDVAGLVRDGRAHVLTLSAEQADRLWRSLAETDGPKAYEAIQTLAQAPARAVPLLRERVQPVSAAKLASLLKDLESDTFAVRERAAIELARFGRFAEPALRKRLREKPPLDVRRRIEEVLDLLNETASMTEYLRSLRGVEILEMIGTPEARQALRDLAGGAAEAALTQHARAALKRLDGRKKQGADGPRSPST